MIYKPCKSCGQRIPKVKDRAICVWCNRERHKLSKYKSYWENPEKARMDAKKKRKQLKYILLKRLQDKKYYIYHREEISLRRKLRREELKRNGKCVNHRNYRKRRKLSRRVHPHGLRWGKGLGNLPVAQHFNICKHK